MTKKHFIALADAIKTTKPTWAEPDAAHGGGQFPALQQWERDLRSLAAFCASQNPRFDRDRWIGYIEGRNGKNGGAIK